MGLLATGIWAADSQCRRIIGDPDYRNIRIHRALEKNGWTGLGELDIRADRRIEFYARPMRAGGHAEGALASKSCTAPLVLSSREALRLGACRRFA